MLLIYLLQAETVIDGFSIDQVSELALSMVRRIEYSWVNPANYDYMYPFPLCFRRVVLVRALCILGLIVKPKIYSEGITSRVIVIIFFMYANRPYSRC